MPDTKRKHARRGPASPGSPSDMKGIEKKHSNPDGTTPHELPTTTPRVPTNSPASRKQP
ncbi:hypothetical protein [Variovorax sp. OV329]|uniref:hypothetical protein n=1 Tax=Variovorax sp. OV329 TaxID=1882825 RepID=UPI0008ECA667|nr:hypothetical protein [Variovorax sp. OV329]SFN19656.1 hypothetical protein SAMN05444747_117122 [Variovorax sp. OV329]